MHSFDGKWQIEVERGSEKTEFARNRGMHLFSQNEELKGGILEWAPGKKLVPFHVLVCTLVCSSVCDCAPIVQACRPFKGTSIWKLAITASGFLSEAQIKDLRTGIYFHSQGNRNLRKYHETCPFLIFLHLSVWIEIVENWGSEWTDLVSWRWPLAKFPSVPSPSAIHLKVLPS